jgi:hypothetical protein
MRRFHDRSVMKLAQAQLALCRRSSRCNLLDQLCAQYPHESGRFMLPLRVFEQSVDSRETLYNAHPYSFMIGNGSLVKRKRWPVSISGKSLKESLVAGRTPIPVPKTSERADGESCSFHLR